MYCGLVYSGTQLFLFHKHLQYSVITEINIIIPVTGVPIVEMNLTLLNDWEVIGIDPSFVKVLFMLNTNMCVISGILLA